MQQASQGTPTIPAHPQQMKRALRKLEEAISRDPENASLLVQRAELLIVLSQYPLAWPGQSTMANSSLSGSNIPAFPQGVPRIATGALVEALQSLWTALALDPQCIANRMRAVQAPNKDQLFLRALFGAFIQLSGPLLFPATKEDPLQYALMAQQIPGLGERALQNIHVALSIYPLSARVHNLRTTVLLLGQAVEEALVCCDLAILLSPEPEDLPYVKQLQEADFLPTPNLVDLYVSKAMVLAGLERFPEALQALEMALHLRPSDPELLQTKEGILSELEGRGQASNKQEPSVLPDETLKRNPSDQPAPAPKEHIEQQQLESGDQHIASRQPSQLVHTANPQQTTAIYQYMMREQLFSKDVLIDSGGCYVLSDLMQNWFHWNVHFGHLAVPLLIFFCLMTIQKMVYAWREGAAFRDLLKEDGHRILLLLPLLALAIITIVVMRNSLAYLEAFIPYLFICLVHILWATRIAQRRIKAYQAQQQGA